MFTKCYAANFIYQPSSPNEDENCTFYVRRGDYHSLMRWTHTNVSIACLFVIPMTEMHNLLSIFHYIALPESYWLNPFKWMCQDFLQDFIVLHLLYQYMYWSSWLRQEQYTLSSTNSLFGSVHYLSRGGGVAGGRVGGS